MRVHQMLVRLDAGDAVSGQALAIHHLLKKRGCESRIFAHGFDEFGNRFAQLDSDYASFRSNPDDLLIFHYSIYCENYREYLKSRNRKVFIYHNITPAEWFEPYDPGAAEMCRKGRELLPQLAHCDLALGDSDFNRRELVEAGFPEERTDVLPISPPEGRLLEGKEDPRIRRLLEDGLINLLFVGRMVPNKCIEDLIGFFGYYHRAVDSRARLVLAGRVFTPYVARLWRLVEELGVQRRVVFLGKVDDCKLRTCFRHSHFYFSMSEHEGFCVPLLEAFSCNLPVFAYAAGAVPETMGDAGVLFTEKDYPMLAELLVKARNDTALKERIIEAQRKRLNDFGWEAFLNRFESTVGVLLGPGKGSA